MPGPAERLATYAAETSSGRRPKRLESLTLTFSEPIVFTGGAAATEVRPNHQPQRLVGEAGIEGDQRARAPGTDPVAARAIRAPKRVRRSRGQSEKGEQAANSAAAAQGPANARTGRRSGATWSTSTSASAGVYQ